MLNGLDLPNLADFHNQILIIDKHRTFPQFYSKAILSRSRGLTSKFTTYYVEKE